VPIGRKRESGDLIKMLSVKESGAVPAAVIPCFIWLYFSKLSVIYFCSRKMPLSPNQRGWEGAVERESQKTCLITQFV